MHGSYRKRRREGVARGNRYCSRLDDRMRGWIKPLISIRARHRVELERITSEPSQDPIDTPFGRRLENEILSARAGQAEPAPDQKVALRREPATNQKRLLDRKSPIQVRIRLPPAENLVRTEA